jgi:hypothetical protein
MARFKQKPVTEQRLSDLQTEYLKTRDIKFYQLIFSELLPYARSLILKKTTGKIYLAPDLIDSAALEATVKFMSQYEKPDFRIDNSFAGILNYKVLESLYGPKVIAADQIASLNEHLESSKSRETEFGDMAESFNFTYMFRPDNANITDDPANYIFNKDQDSIESVMTVITDLYHSVSLYYFFLVTEGLYHYFNKTKTYDQYRTAYLDDKAKEILDVGILEVYKRLSSTA